jgi:UDP-glucose 4-epimerase
MTRWDPAYAGRRVLVVGGLGFIGANLSRRLVSIGARVTIVTPTLARHDADARELAASGVSVVEADLRDAGQTRAAVAGQTLVFNMSGQSGAVRSMEDPFTDLDVNCRGNLVLLEAVREQTAPPKIVFPGSRLEYGRPVTIPVEEDAALAPLCVHAVHKIAVEQYLKIYGQLYGVRSTILRITNPFGPGQPAGRSAYGIVNRMIQLALDDEPLPVYGDGAQQRDYIYIEDVIDALLGAGVETVTDGRTYNLGSGVGISFLEMARAVIAHAGGGRTVIQPWPALAAQIETGDFIADVWRLSADIGWKPATSFEDGLTRTIAAYRSRVRV